MMDHDHSTGLDTRAILCRACNCSICYYDLTARKDSKLTREIFVKEWGNRFAKNRFTGKR